MAGMLKIMQVIGIIHNTLYINLIVAHGNLKLKNIFFTGHTVWICLYMQT